MLDRGGVAGPGDVLIVGDDDAVARSLERIRDTGLTEILAAPIGTPIEQTRTTTTPACYSS
jgi:hypothetical protein